MAHRTILLAVTLALAPVVGPAQEPSQPPKFAARTEVVLVDFVVGDKSERPVRGLSARDFVVKEDGKERPIVSFAAFDGSEPAGAVPAAAARLAGAATVVLVDDGQLTQPQSVRVRPDLKALLARICERSGSVSLVAPWSKISEARALPVGAEDLSASVDRIVGRRSEDHSDLPMSDAEAIAIARGDQQMLVRLGGRFMALNPALNKEMAEPVAKARANEVAFDARQGRDVVYGAAMLAFDWLATQPGRHSLVIVSGGFAHDPDDAKYNDIVTRSLRVNAPIHFLDARGLQSIGRFQSTGFGAALPAGTGEVPMAWSSASEGSAVLADDTGGITVRNTNDLSKGVGRILDTIQTYYVLGYEAPPQTKPGFRRIKVEARTKGLNVRARRGYYDDARGAATGGL